MKCNTKATCTRIRFPSVFILFSVLKGVENNGHYLKQYENAMKTYTCGRGLSSIYGTVFSGIVR